MVSTITRRRMRKDTDRILRQLEAGREFLVTKGGVVVGRLAPIGDTPPLDARTLRKLRRTTARVELIGLDADVVDLAGARPAGSGEVPDAPHAVGQ